MRALRGGYAEIVREGMSSQVVLCIRGAVVLTVYGACFGI